MSNLPELFNLPGRAALVTGGAGLLGSEFCRTLAEAGAAVAIADLDVAKAGALVHELEQNGLSALAVAADVSNPDSVKWMVEACLKSFGRLDILVNSAALDPKFDPKAQGAGAKVSGEENSASYALTFENYPLDLWNQALAVNLTGMFLCCQAAAPAMLAQGQGVIINLSSIYGLAGPDQRLYQRQGQPPQYKPVYYSVTKAGVIGLTRYLATYYTGKNIRVNTLSPGGVFNGHDQEFTNAYSARAVLGRMAYKDDMNGALLFLASDASKYMTGANLVVDGGWTTW